MNINQSFNLKKFERCEALSMFSGRNSGGVEEQPPAPPSVNRHSLSEIFGSVGIFNAIEYAEINRNNYGRVRQPICTERRFAIALICCVNHFSHFRACSYLLKKKKL